MRFSSAPLRACEDPKRMFRWLSILLGMVPRSITEQMHAEHEAETLTSQCLRCRRMMSVLVIVMSWFRRICVVS